MEKASPRGKRSRHAGVPVDPEIRSRSADPLHFELIGLSGSAQFLIAGGGVARVTILMGPFSTVRHWSRFDLEPLPTSKLCVFDLPCSKPIGYSLLGHPLLSSRWSSQDRNSSARAQKTVHFNGATRTAFAAQNGFRDKQVGNVPGHRELIHVLDVRYRYPGPVYALAVEPFARFAHSFLVII